MRLANTWGRFWTAEFSVEANRLEGDALFSAAASLAEMPCRSISIRRPNPRGLAIVQSHLTLARFRSRASVAGHLSAVGRRSVAVRRRARLVRQRIFACRWNRTRGARTDGRRKRRTSADVPTNRPQLSECASPGARAEERRRAWPHWLVAGRYRAGQHTRSSPLNCI